MNSKAERLEQAATDLTKRLTDEGRLIETGFVIFAHAMMKGVSPTRHIDARLAFMAGAEHVFSSIMNIMDEGDEPTEDDLRRMDLIQKEIDEVARETVRAVQPGRGARVIEIPEDHLFAMVRASIGMAHPEAQARYLNGLFQFYMEQDPVDYQEAFDAGLANMRAGMKKKRGR